MTTADTIPSIGPGLPVWRERWGRQRTIILAEPVGSGARVIGIDQSGHLVNISWSTFVRGWRHVENVDLRKVSEGQLRTPPAELHEVIAQGKDGELLSFKVLLIPRTPSPDEEPAFFALVENLDSGSWREFPPEHGVTKSEFVAKVKAMALASVEHPLAHPPEANLARRPPVGHPSGLN
jgi:hypothetical protein